MLATFLLYSYSRRAIHHGPSLFAQFELEEQVDIHVVQDLPGHSNIATTTRYLHLSDTDLADAVDRAFPETSSEIANWAVDLNGVEEASYRFRRISGYIPNCNSNACR
ncbi:MAG: hypothetical protein ABSC00_04490 [Acidimicrobiales bacterium]